MEKEIYVDENGYNEFFLELETLKKLLLSNASEGSKAYQEAVGDGWHDHFAFEQSMINERNIAKQIDDMLKDSKKLIIVKEDIINKNIIKTNSNATLELTYQNLEKELIEIKLTGNYKPKIDAEPMEITLNSPIGKEIYKKKKGDELSCYIGDKKIYIKILEVNNLH